MIIDFLNLPYEDIPHFKDGEGQLHVQMYWDGETRAMHGVLAPGASIGLHRHEANCEILFLLRGHATLLEDGERHSLIAGQATFCPNQHEHSLINTGAEDVEFYAAVIKQ